MTARSRQARVAGALYLVASLVGVVRLLYIPSRLIVAGDAAATAANLRAHEMLFRWGLVSQLAAAVLWLFVVLALYELLKGVGQGLAELMVLLGALMVVPISFANVANDAAAMLLVHGASFLNVFEPAQRDAMAMFFLRLHHYGDLANEVFWGLWLLPFGLLVYRSRFLPWLLGVWLMAGCFGYLAVSFAGFVHPEQEGTVAIWAQALMIGELAMMLWLLVMGAREKAEG